jgi:1-deoxyxylulose-5-phosphate synthase
MEYINLGSTGLKVSRICLGAMTFGSPKWRDWVLDEEASRPFIRRALSAANHFALFPEHNHSHPQTCNR